MSQAGQDQPGLPSVAPGGYYVVILRDPERSTAAEVLRATVTLGLTRASPVDFGELCLCCDRPTTARSNFKTGTGLEAYSDPVEVPCCPACSKHLVHPRWLRLGFGCLHAIPLLTIGLGVCDLFIRALGERGGELFVGIGFVLFLASLAIRSAYGVWRRRVVPEGHAPWATLDLGPNQVVLRTCNRRLVERLQARPECVSVSPMSFLSA